MVFAINSDESGARNFAAFQSLAKALNGTASNSTGTGGGSTTGNQGAGVANGVGAGFVLTLAAVLLGSVL